MPQYSIEARSLSIVGGTAGHDFWVLRDENGKALAELHGLATDRKTNEFVPIGTDEEKHSLRVWHFPHDPVYANSHGEQATSDSFIRAEQAHRTVLTADSKEVLGRWNAAVNAVDTLNALDLDYPNYGFKAFGKTVNSNSTYNTLGQIMGVPAKDFTGRLEPGINNLMIPPKEIEKLRTHGFPALEEPRIDPAPRRTGVLDPRQPGHPDHALYMQIHDGVEKLNAQYNQPWDERSDCITARLLAVCKEAKPPIEQVDHVVASRRSPTSDVQAGQNLFVVEGRMDDPAHNRAHVNTLEAMRTPETESFQRVADINQKLTQETQMRWQQQTLDNPSSGSLESTGPHIRS